MRTLKREGNFSRKTIDALAKRAAYTCSLCKISTLSAAESSNSEHAHTGQAAHIFAAAPNGPRANKAASSEEKANISNGVYLCEICAKLIDANRGKDYPPERLRKIKDDHETSTRQKAIPLNLETLQIQPRLNALEEAESWENLMECFSQSCAQKIINAILDPRMQLHMKDHNGPGKKKWLTDKFRKISLAVGDPRARTFIRIQKESIQSLDSLINDKDADTFLQKWDLHHKELSFLMRP
jgi:hypothetical protein